MQETTTLERPSSIATSRKQQPGDRPSHADYSRFSTESLSHAADQLHGIQNAALAELFAVVRELHTRNAFAADGAKDAAGWLQVRFGLPYRTAARWAEVALALEELPHLREAFAEGLLCLDKVAAATKFATPETDEQIAREARKMTVTALENAARRQKEVGPDQEARVRRNRKVWWTWRDGGTRFHLEADTTAEQGARIAAALERTAAGLPHMDQDGPVSMAQRRADALSALASVQIAEDSDQDRATVVVHVDLETLRTGIGSGWSEEGALLSSETVDKLLCDSRLKALIEDDRGKPLGVGRAMRTPPRWMRQALKTRDLTCCFPGCDCTLFLTPHHNRTWTKERGPTDPENLPMLCPVHHRLVHGADWWIEGTPSEGLRFIGPKGPVRDGPPPLDYDVKKWLWEDLYRPSPEQLFDDAG
jgi:hypothetical protein